MRISGLCCYKYKQNSNADFPLCRVQTQRVHAVHLVQSPFRKSVIWLQCAESPVQGLQQLDVSAGL